MPTLVQPRKARKGGRLVARVSAEGKAAEETPDARERIVLNAAQSRRFVEALLAPPRPPTPRMREAMRAYRATVKSDLD